MKINLPSYTYKKKYSSKNYFYQELIAKNEVEWTVHKISQNGFSWFEINCIDKILIIPKKTNSKILLEYERVLILNEGELTESAISENTNTYSWYKHPLIQNNIPFDDTYLNDINNSWDWFNIVSEDKENWKKWLREPQIWALYSLLSNFTISNNTFTIVMPTWTGKTETMLAALLKIRFKKLLVIVPSDSLREQISDKFITLWKFAELWMIDNDLKKPVVGVLKSKITDIKDFFSKANVIVSTMSIVSWLDDLKQKEIWELCSALFIDEAHHTAAKTWNKFKENFWNLNIVQFTATPFRNDKKRISWKIIYNYPLRKAQENEYFKKIIFKSILEPDLKKADSLISKTAIEQLEEDLKKWSNHILMARCENIESADFIYNQYYNIDPCKKYNPILIHSKIPWVKKQSLLNDLKVWKSKIVVCVDMLWEWYDLPTLKIAALHSAHKSLWITLQFIWRFTRVWWLNLWNATFVANIADKSFENSLREMYSENSDWNTLIEKWSKLYIEKQIKFQEFIDWFDNLDVSIWDIKAPFSSVFFKVNDIIWDSSSIQKCINDNFNSDNIKFSINEENKMIVVIEQAIWTPNFWDFKELTEIQYLLHIVCYDETQSMFYVLSDVESRRESIVKSFWGTYKLVSEDDVYKAFYDLKMLQLFTVWLKDWNPWNIKYRMYAWVDIKRQLTSQEQLNKVKSNIFWFWFEDGYATSIWASRKWKIWSKLTWNLVEWKEWCIKISSKLKNPDANWKSILDWVLEPTIISSIPLEYPISVEWNENIYFDYDRIYFKGNSSWIQVWIEDVKIDLFKLNDDKEDTRKKMKLWEIKFTIESDGLFYAEFEWFIDWTWDNAKIIFRKINWDDLTIINGKKITSIIDYLNFNPITIRYPNWSYLQGIFLFEIKYNLVWFDKNKIKVIDWNWVNIKHESKVKDWNIISDSIQNNMIELLKSSWNYKVIFNDDGSWEIADIVWIRFDEKQYKITLELYHCKYSWESNPWARVTDLYEVCGQTQKSILLTII